MISGVELWALWRSSRNMTRARTMNDSTTPPWTIADVHRAFGHGYATHAHLLSGPSLASACGFRSCLLCLLARVSASCIIQCVRFYNRARASAIRHRVRIVMVVRSIPRCVLLVRSENWPLSRWFSANVWKLRFIWDVSWERTNTEHTHVCSVLRSGLFSFSISFINFRAETEGAR